MSIIFYLQQTKKWEQEIFLSHLKKLKNGIIVIILRDIALKAFTEEELKFSFKDIESLQDACTALNLDYIDVRSRAAIITQYSRASAAMFKLNIIKKALY